MGGKPSKGTPRDMRLAANRNPAGSKPTKSMPLPATRKTPPKPGKKGC